jgi:hypothetical protein
MARVLRESSDGEREKLEQAVRGRFEALAAVMDERQVRLWAGAEANAIGTGGGALVSRATGISERRIVAGRRELAELTRTPPTSRARSQRVRRPGGGRPRADHSDLKLLAALEDLVAPATRGDPESPLRWTSKGVRALATELRDLGHDVGPTTVASLLHQLGYSLQAAKKTVEGKQHPDRDEQFQNINTTTKDCIARGVPVISVDTKKKELVGYFKNGGREWQPVGDPTRALVHDFPADAVGKAIPYGVYDTGRNEAWVSVGTDHDTAEFAVATIARWWKAMGRKAYPGAKELFITADAGGSNGYRCRQWKVGLQELADATGIHIHVSHFPPGTSKWNKIEHRLFAHISMNWRGKLLTSHEAIVSLIAGTSTRTGLRVKAKLDRRKYRTGLEVSDRVFKQLQVEPHDFQGSWNYTIRPRDTHSRDQ